VNTIPEFEMCKSSNKPEKNLVGDKLPSLFCPIASVEEQKNISRHTNTIHSFNASCLFEKISFLTKKQGQTL